MCRQRRKPPAWKNKRSLKRMGTNHSKKGCRPPEPEGCRPEDQEGQPPDTARHSPPERWIEYSEAPEAKGLTNKDKRQRGRNVSLNEDLASEASDLEAPEDQSSWSFEPSVREPSNLAKKTSRRPLFSRWVGWSVFVFCFQAVRKCAILVQYSQFRDMQIIYLKNWEGWTFFRHQKLQNCGTQIKFMNVFWNRRFLTNFVAPFEDAKMFFKSKISNLSLSFWMPELFRVFQRTEAKKVILRTIGGFKLKQVQVELLLYRNYQQVSTNSSKCSKLDNLQPFYVAMQLGVQAGC